MVFYHLSLDYALEGNSNFTALRHKMEVVLEDNVLKEFIDQEIYNLATSNAKNLAEWNKCVAKLRQIILGGILDHIV